MNERKQKTKQSPHREERIYFCFHSMRGVHDGGRSMEQRPQQKPRGFLSPLQHQAESRLGGAWVQPLTVCILPARVHLTAFTASLSGTTKSRPRLTPKSHGDIAYSSHHRGCRVTIVVMAMLRLSLSVSNVLISGMHNKLTPCTWSLGSLRDCVVCPLKLLYFQYHHILLYLP